jgi:hypothetical protein
MSIVRSVLAVSALCAVAGAFAGVAAVGCNETAPQAKEKGTVIEVSEAAASLDSAFDATPDPFGDTIYFIASVSNGAGVFKVSGAGGTVTEVFVGKPFVEPRGISMSTDGASILVADLGADPDGGGAILVLDPDGGVAPVALKGSEGLHPRAIDVIEGTSEDQVYFAGKKADDTPAIFRLGEKGGTAEIVSEGGSLAQPDGLAVTFDGVVYVADHGKDDPTEGRVLEIVGDQVTPIADGILLGEPAGIALLLDESAILVSSVNPDEKSSQVVIIDAKKHATAIFDDVIKENSGSGGLHRAHTKNVFAWAGYLGGTSGGVYKVKVYPQPKSSSAIAGPGD